MIFFKQIAYLLLFLLLLSSTSCGRYGKLKITPRKTTQQQPEQQNNNNNVANYTLSFDEVNDDFTF